MSDTNLENPFEGFNFLNDAPPAKIVKQQKETKEEENPGEDELSEDELKAIEEQASKQASKKASKEEEKEEEEEKEKTPSKSKKEKEEKPENTEEEEEEESEEVNPLAEYALFMASKGILDLQDEDVVESEEDLEKIQLRTIQNGIEGYKKSIPEDGQKFLEFLEAGGNPEDFHKYYYGDASFLNFDIDSEENQKYVVSEALKLEGYSEEEIEDEINDAIDLGKLERKAATHLKKLQKIESEQKDMLIASQKEYAKQQELRRVQEWENFKNGLYNKEEISGFKFNKKMKDDLWDYMTRVDKKTGMTKYQQDSQENEDARYMFAYLLKNKWDVKSLEKQVEGKAVGNLRKKLSNFTDTRTKLKAAGNKYEAEDKSNPFSGFKKLT